MTQQQNEDDKLTAPDDDRQQEVPFSATELALSNYIMLHRIYDVLVAMGLTIEPSRVMEVVELHEQGIFKSAPASMMIGEEDET